VDWQQEQSPTSVQSAQNDFQNEKIVNHETHHYLFAIAFFCGLFECPAFGGVRGRKYFRMACGHIA
jgi:hypothetical protein